MMEILKPEIKVEGSGKFAKFIVTPLAQGYGVTLGNSMRRVLLGDLPGIAVSGLKIAGALHEFSVIKGVKEDVVDIVLNLKTLILKTDVKGNDFKATLKIRKNGAGEVYAKDIEFHDQVEVVNKDLLICTCNSDAKLEMELFVTAGKGYKPASTQVNEDMEIGYVPIDAIYAPVIKVNYSVENARVGQSIDYDKLVLEVETNGAYLAKEVVSLSAKVIKEHLDLFINLVERMDETEIFASVEESSPVRVLEMSVEDMELSVRSLNCLVKAGYKKVEDVIKLSIEELSHLKNLGAKSCEEIQDKIRGYGLKFKDEV